ncbi:MAG: M23 family metallopeptidase [Novosphingobium sp.]
MRASRRSILAGGLALGLTNSPLRAITMQPTAWGNFGLTIDAGEQTQGGWLKGRLTGPRTGPGQIIGLQLGDTPVALDAAGGFFLGFDRDAGNVAYLKGTCASAGGCTTRHEPPEFGFTIAPRQWDIQNVDAPFRPANLPDAEFQRIRPLELAQISAARAMTTDAAGWRQAMIWPVQGRISGKFGAQRIYRGQPGSYHSGLDIAGGQGATYVAPADGVVVLAAPSPFTLEGNLLMIDHGMGLSSAFLHSSRLLVRLGDHVRQGQAIGAIGMTGRATGPHLHWALKWHEARLDPLLFVPARL